MAGLKNLTIRYKLTAIVMIISVAVLLMTSVAYIAYEQKTLRNELVDNIYCIAKMIGDNCEAALIFDDSEDAGATLATLQAVPSITYACIYTPDGKVFAEYYSNDAVGVVSPPSCKTNCHNFENGSFNLFQQIEGEDGQVGTVFIKTNLDELYQVMIQNIEITIVLIIVASFIAYILCIKLQKIISEPILKLANTAQDISRNHEYAECTANHSGDEIGVLIESFNEMVHQIQEREMALRESEEKIRSFNEELEQRVKERTAELKETHEKLVTVSWQAGMAEVATDVLHNVGNVLNSVNVSVNLITENIQDSKVLKLKEVTDMMNERLDDISNFLAHDPKGQRIPSYLNKVSSILTNEQTNTLHQLQTLSKNVEHIKEIVRMQQSYAKVSGIELEMSIQELIDDAMQINMSSLKRHHINVEYNFEDLPKLYIDKQKVLQILVNLINNAKDALAESDQTDKQITITVCKEHDDMVSLEVADNGIGIEAGNLDKVFRHGFTTKPEGHGFGLHSSALAAKEMKGRLTILSDGIGKGASVKLNLPFKPVEMSNEK